MKKMIVFIIISVASYFFFNSEYFKIKEVEYNKCGYNKEYRIENIIDSETNYFAVTKDKIKKNVLKDPLVESVIVNKVFPNKIKIDIIYKKPFIEIIDNNISLVIDNGGTVLAINEKLITEYRVDGLEISYYMLGKSLEIYDNKLLLRLISLINLINKSGVAISGNISYNENSVIIQTKNGMKVKFGDCSEIEKKFNNFVNIYYDLLNKKINYGTIDVSITDLPLFRKGN